MIKAKIHQALGLGFLRFPTYNRRVRITLMQKQVNRIAEEIIGTTQNGLLVYVDPKGSHAATHLKDTPELRELVREALLRVKPVSARDRLEVDLGRIIGHSELVEVRPEDRVFYAIRVGRKTYTPFVDGREPVPTSWVALTLERRDEHSWTLYSAWIGRQTPSLPGDPGEDARSGEFWTRHALVFGRQEIVSGSRRETCPW